MDRATYYAKRRDWRCIRNIIYQEDSPITYEQRLHKEKLFAPFATARPQPPDDIPNLMKYARRALERGAPPERVWARVRDYIKQNTKAGRGKSSHSHPVYW